jgi:hypothetical protein
MESRGKACPRMAVNRPGKVIGSGERRIGFHLSAAEARDTRVPQLTGVKMGLQGTRFSDNWMRQSKNAEWSAGIYRGFRIYKEEKLLESLRLTKCHY